MKLYAEMLKLKAGNQFGQNSFGWLTVGFHSDHNHPRQMPDGCHHYPHIEGKLIGAALLEELALEEHARSLAELNDGA